MLHRDGPAVRIRSRRGIQVAHRIGQCRTSRAPAHWMASLRKQTNLDLRHRSPERLNKWMLAAPQERPFHISPPSVSFR